MPFWSACIVLGLLDAAKAGFRSPEPKAHR